VTLENTLDLDKLGKSWKGIEPLLPSVDVKPLVVFKSQRDHDVRSILVWL